VERINSEAEAARAKARKIDAEIDLREAQKRKERMEAEEEQQAHQPEVIVDNSGEATALQGILQTHSSLLMKLLEKNGSQEKTSSALEIVSAVAALVPKMDPLDLIRKLQELTPKAEVEFQSFLKGVDFARENLPARNGEKQGFWSDVLAKALDRLPAAIPAIMGGVAAMKSGASPAAVAGESARGALAGSSPASSAEEQAKAAEQLLPGILADLKQRARARKDPELLADFITEECADNSHYQALAGILLSKPLEYFGQADPEIMQPLYKPWFEALYARLKENFGPEQAGPQSAEGGKRTEQ
jgi:hypothetical protein